MKILALTNRISALTNWFSGRNVQKTNSNLLKFGMVLLFSVTLWGCGKGNAAAPVTIDPVTKKHPIGMAVASTGGAHVDAYFANPAGCEGCHGKTKDLTGGIAKVSCSTISRSGMSCHAGKFPHGTGFDDPAAHGPKALNAAVGANGIAFCRKCHGNDYNGISGSGVSCIACHRARGSNPSTNAPHPSAWKGFAADHKVVHPSNMPACADCHWGRDLNPATAKPGHVIPAGVTPTCEGTTFVCHFKASHDLPYTAATAHGAAALANLMSCAECHADNSAVPPVFNKTLNANLTPNGCQKCHTQAGLAHPYGWLPGRGASTTTSHTTANFGTAGAYCSPCHALTGTTPLPNSVAPSCMTQTAQIGGTTFCHFTGNPVANSGCKSCHGVNTLNGQPDGIAAPNRDFRHSVHFAKMPGLTCAVCHSGLGTGQTSHATIAPGTTAAVLIPGPPASPTFSDLGTAAYLPNIQNGKCSFVSCHGGKQLAGITLGWRSTPPGTIGTNCLACHTVSSVAPASYPAPTRSYIGPFSGFSTLNSLSGPNLHIAHAQSFNRACTDCHDENKIHSQMLQGKRTLLRNFAQNSIIQGVKITSYAYTSPTTSTCAVTPGGGCHDLLTPAIRSWHKLGQ